MSGLALNDQHFGLAVVIGLSVLFLISTYSAGAQQDSLYREVPVKKGDICIVCDAPSYKLNKVILYKGRRVQLCPIHESTFYSNPYPYFKKMQPSGALFDEEAVVEKPFKWGWMVLGIWILISLITGAISSNIAVRKCLPPIKWFFIGIIGNIGGVLWIIYKKAAGEIEIPSGFRKIPTTHDPIFCPKCGSENHPCAQKCSYCHHQLIPEKDSEVTRVGL